MITEANRAGPTWITSEATPLGGRPDSACRLPESGTRTRSPCRSPLPPAPLGAAACGLRRRQRAQAVEWMIAAEVGSDRPAAPHPQGLAARSSPDGDGAIGHALTPEGAITITEKARSRVT